MMDDKELFEEQDNYGTPNSLLLKKIIEAGFKPIAITIMAVEETFVFKTEKEANEASEKFMPEGWWYPFSEWDKTRKWYVKTFYGGDETLAPPVYWLDKNFKPKDSENDI